VPFVCLIAYKALVIGTHAYGTVTLAIFNSRNCQVAELLQASGHRSPASLDGLSFSLLVVSALLEVFSPTPNCSMHPSFFVILGTLTGVLFLFLSRGNLRQGDEYEAGERNYTSNDGESFRESNCDRTAEKAGADSR